MKWTTQIHVEKPDRQLNHKDKILLLGSCFADNMGERFKEHKFRAMVNPHGVLYNPLSVIQVIQDALGDGNNLAMDFIQHNDLWHSFKHHGSFSTPSKQDLEERIVETRQKVRDWLKDLDYLFITWGTAWVYRFLESDRVVSNCHKLPSSQFKRFRLGVDDIVHAYSLLFDRFIEINPNLNVVITVSPVRHLKDTAHGNQLSKSVLLLAAEALKGKYETVDYFPSYEIVLDELRDYRFYSSDMLHPNQTAVRYIWEKFAETWMSSDARLTSEEALKLVSASMHRPLHVATLQHQKFVRNTLGKIHAFVKKHPYVNFEKEIQRLNEQLVEL